MIKGTVVGGDAVIKKMLTLGPTVEGRIFTFVQRMAIKLQRNIKAEKLTGQVLHVRTGTLRRSITQKVERSYSGVVATVGTNVKYARMHEYGFTGTETVKSHLRTIKQAFGRPISPVTFTVASHSRKVNFPERSFLRSALADMSGEIRDGLDREVRSALGRVL